jgi:imidazolonepropionase-like amidohydrolase
MRRLASLAFICALGSGGAACADTLVIQATKIYPSPDEPAITDGVVLVRDGKILAVGKKGHLRIPSNAKVSECGGGVVTAGFQNSHVHFIEDRWTNAAQRPASELSRSFEEMLTRYGFTSVFDVASDQSNTFALRARVESGEVRGPRILTAGLALFPPDGLPFYIHDMPADVLSRMHQPRTAAEATKNVQENLAAGTNATKLFVVTSTDGHTLRFMSLDIAKAAAEETHAHGKLVLAHPSTVDGVRLSAAAGVDVVVHTTLGEKEPWDEALMRKMVAQHMSVIPTFQLWPYELRKESVPADIVQKLLEATFEELRAFRAAGGQVLFGTDVGYMHEYDPADEYAFMAQSGMTPLQILASLTTAPAARWNEQQQRGRVAPKLDADLVVLAADPEDDVRNFANVRCAFRAGVSIYSAAPVH